MNFQHLLPFIFVGAIICFFAFQVISKGGLKAAMFGAPIARTVGQVTGSGSKLMTIVLKVHVLGGDSPDRAVGLELLATSIGSYQMMPLSLSADEAKKLITLLQDATREGPFPH